jgi:2-alkyl-3-oxoalkanoate reductase
MKGVTIGVLGAGGFVGGRLMQLARGRAGVEAVALIRGFRSLGKVSATPVTYRKIDTRTAAGMAAGLKGCDVVVNVTLGEVADITSETLAMVAACRAAAVPRFIHMSSAVVYGSVPRANLPEDAPTSPHRWMLYAREKARTEDALRREMRQPGLEIIVLRPGLIWGPGSNWARQIGGELSAGMTLINGGRGICNLVYVDNLVELILAAAVRPGRGSGFYNARDAESQTWLRYAAAMAAALGLPPERVRTVESAALPLSPKLGLEWALNQRPLYRLMRATLKRLSPEAKQSLKTRVAALTGGGPRPPAEAGAALALGAGSPGPLPQPRLNREHWALQMTRFALPADAFARDFGPVDLLPFPAAVTRTAEWFKFVTAEEATGPRQSMHRDRGRVSVTATHHDALSSEQPPSHPVTLPLRVAISGCGAALELLHRGPLEHAVKMGWITVVALADPVEARRRVASTWFPGVRTYRDAVGLFACEAGIHLALIASPPPYHQTDAEAALRAGADVLCEKPLAQDVAAARAIQHAAEMAGCLLGVGMTRRFYPAVEELRRRLLTLDPARPARFYFRQGGVYGWPVASAAPFQRATGGGGVLLDMGVHMIDILGLIAGWGDVTQAQDDALHGGVEANAVVDLALARAHGRLHVSWDTNLDSALRIVTDEEEYWMPVGSLDILHRRPRGGTWERLPLTATWPTDLSATPILAAPRSHNECMSFQLIAMLRSILHGEPLVATGQDGISALQLIHRAYAIAQPLAQPWLSPEEQAARAQDHWTNEKPA